MTLDIISTGEYPLDVLSNFYPNSFELDGVNCASMEGFLQSLKTKNVKTQVKVCALYGKEAKKYFKHSLNNIRWKLFGTLYWQGKKYKRTGEEHQQLLDRAYDALSKNVVFAEALMETGEATLVHTIGKSKIRSTILTEKEFTDRLYRIRDKYKKDI